MKRKRFSLDRRLLENFSWPLILSMLALVAIGLINLYSVSLGTSIQGQDNTQEFIKQLSFFGIGLVCSLLILFFDYGLLQKVSIYIYVLGIGLLLLVELIGHTAGGATRWLFIGPLRFQPSEFVKPMLVVVLAAYFSRKEIAKNGLTILGFIPPLILIGIPFGFIIMQPDLGTSGLLLFTVFPLFLFVRLRKSLILTTVGLLAASIIWMTCLGGFQFLQEKEIIRGYQLERVFTHKNPEDDHNGKGWQIIQSKSAIGSGKILGRGFHGGTQQKYGFLPAPKTDFAFSALSEEWGFLGATIVLSLFYCLFTAAFGIIRRSKDTFGKLLTLGLTSLIFWQMLINILMVTGLFPVVGIPLPFVSYGGTSLLVTMVAVAIIANVGMRRYLFQDDPVIENPKVWQKNKAVELKESIPLTRRLKPYDPTDPDIFPEYRLPHQRPWLKYLNRRILSLPDWAEGDSLSFSRETIRKRSLRPEDFDFTP
ncbi:MAG: rod shape-determining protein RodA [Deltaproteobacteria bacterium]|nr:rod shape-determining protein RodA [Deltaproteobacteria bacterium]